MCFDKIHITRLGSNLCFLIFSNFYVQIYRFNNSLILYLIYLILVVAAFTPSPLQSLPFSKTEGNHCVNSSHMGSVDLAQVSWTSGCCSAFLLMSSSPPHSFNIFSIVAWHPLCVSETFWNAGFCSSMLHSIWWAQVCPGGGTCCN